MNLAHRISSILILCTAITIGCRPRSATEDPAAGSPNPATADSSRVDTLEVLIESLKNQLETNQKISDSDRLALEQKIKDAEAERTKAQMADNKTPGATPTPTPTPAPASTPGTPPAPKVEGPYAIYYATDCFQPLDTVNLADGSIFKAGPCNNTLTVQQFTLEMKDAGYFRIVHKMAKKCLVLTGNTAGEGTPPTLLPCKATAENNEQWQFFEAAADGSNFKLRSRLSNFCLKIGVDGTIFQGSCVNNYTTLMLRKTP